jgi:colanic acid/amylovoran biosynthesis glycosyltransferase
MTGASSPSDRRRSLAVLTALPCQPKGPGRFELTRKFIEGMQAYAHAWDGPVAAYFDPASSDLSDLDRTTISRADIDFDVRILPFDSELYPELEGRGVVLGNHFRLPLLARRCDELGVASVYNPEYTLRTRLQFIRASRPNPLRQVRGAVWELGEERRLVQQLRRAHGVQCNGLPSYRAYARLNRAPLLYFDTRVNTANLIGEGELLAANRRRAQRQPLHLVFFGRLIPAKGADHLLDVALALRKRQVPFRMTICGDGPLKAGLEQRILAAGLGDVVELPGVLDFARELLPFLKRAADLFVCCHRQGDPSCSYLEAFACGVPVVGYANEALAGLVDTTQAGASSPLDRSAALARLIARVDEDRGLLSMWAYRARAFAAEHTMERTFEARIAHLREAREHVQRRAPSSAIPDGDAARMGPITPRDQWSH